MAMLISMQASNITIPIFGGTVYLVFSTEKLLIPNRNLGIIFAMMVFFLGTYLLATEFIVCTLA